MQISLRSVSFGNILVITRELRAVPLRMVLGHYYRCWPFWKPLDNILSGCCHNNDQPSPFWPVSPSNHYLDGFREDLLTYHNFLLVFLEIGTGYIHGYTHVVFFDIKTGI